MEIFAKHFWEKEGKLQETEKTDTWHFNTQERKTKIQEEMYWLQDSVHYIENEILLICIVICLDFQNLDFFLQQLQSEHNLVYVIHYAEPFRDITL